MVKITFKRNLMENTMNVHMLNTHLEIKSKFDELNEIDDKKTNESNKVDDKKEEKRSKKNNKEYFKKFYDKMENKHRICEECGLQYSYFNKWKHTKSKIHELNKKIKEMEKKIEEKI